MLNQLVLGQGPIVTSMGFFCGLKTKVIWAFGYILKNFGLIPNLWDLRYIIKQ